MRMTQKQNWFLAIVVIALLSGLPVKAQVKIGDQDPPKAFSILELASGNNKGLRLPQITNTAQRDAAFTNVSAFYSDPLSRGMQIYNIDTKQVETWDGSRWVGSGEKAIWFPSTDFPWGNQGEVKTVDLFTEYQKVFTTTGGYGAGAKYFSSTGGKINVPGYSDKTASDFYYIITDYDDTAIEDVSVNSSGVFSYKIKKAISGNAWVNILLVKK